MRKIVFGLTASAMALSLANVPAAADPAAVKQAVATDYDRHLEELFLHFSGLDRVMLERLAVAGLPGQ